MPRSAAKQTPHWAAARRDGAFRAVYFVASLAKGAGHSLRLAPRSPSRNASVAIANGCAEAPEGRPVLDGGVQCALRVRLLALRDARARREEFRRRQGDGPVRPHRVARGPAERCGAEGADPQGGGAERRRSQVDAHRHAGGEAAARGSRGPRKGAAPELPGARRLRGDDARAASANTSSGSTRQNAKRPAKSASRQRSSGSARESRRNGSAAEAEPGRVSAGAPTSREMRRRPPHRRTCRTRARSCPANAAVGPSSRARTGADTPRFSATGAGTPHSGSAWRS